MRKSFLNKNALALSILILLSAFLVARLPFFLSCPVPEPQTEDTPEYFEVVMKMLAGNSKVDFSFIPIGYPLFLLLIGLIKNTLLAVAITQNILALISCLFFIYAIHQCYPKLTIWAALVFAGYLSSENNIHWDTHFTPDSLYTSLLIFFSGFLMLALKKENLIFGALASATAAYLLLIRASAVFIIPVMICVVAFLIYNNYNRKKIIGFVLPFLSILLIYSAYNYYSTGIFNFITTARFQLGKTTSPYALRTDEEQNFINEAIRFLPPENEFDLIKNSWNVKKVTNAKLETRFGNELYIDSTGNLFFKTVFFKKMVLDTIVTPKNKDAFTNYKNEFIKRFGSSICVIKPEENKAKIKVLNFAFYFTNFTEKFNYYEHWWGYNYWFFHVGRTQTKAYTWHTFFTGLAGKPIPDDLRKFTFKEMADYRQKTGADYEVEKDKRDNSIVYRIYIKVKKYLIAPLFRNYAWVLIFIIAFFISGYKTLTSKFINTEAFIIFMLCAINIGSALVFTLWGAAMPRYSFTTEFTYYAVVALLPALINFSILKDKLKKQSDKP